MEASSPEITESQSKNAILSARQFYCNDPLLVLLKEKLHLNDFWISAGALLFPGMVFLCWWLLWADRTHLWTPDNTLSVLLQTFVLFPFIFLIYVLVPDSTASLFNTLKINGVIGKQRRKQSGTETYEDFAQQLSAWIGKSWWTVAIMGIVVGYALYRLLLLEPTSASPVPYWMRFCAVIIYLPMMYATGISVVRLLLALFFTNLLFYRFTLQVKPLHPDGAGGLGVLGRLLWLCVCIMLWVALLLVATVLSRNLNWLSLTEMILLGAIYISLTPALLLGWLIFPHQLMVKARDEALQPLTNEYQQALLQPLSAGTQDTRSVVAETRRLLALKQRYELVRDSFPIWPMEASALSRVGVTVILPLILPLITSLVTLALHALGLQ